MNLSWLKYLSLIFQLKDVAQVYKEENSLPKPVYLSRRFVGAVLTFISVVVAALVGVSFDASMLETLTDNIIGLISVVVSLYGVVMVIIGYFKRDKNTTIPPTSTTPTTPSQP